MMVKDMRDLAKQFLEGVNQRSQDSDRHFMDLLKVIENDIPENELVNLGYSRGVLSVGVISTAVYQEVSQFHKTNWLKRLAEQKSKVKKIRVALIDRSGEQHD